jgi:hypothetical protein
MSLFLSLLFFLVTGLAVDIRCMRNGLQHVEVSALEPDGDVKEAMELLLQLVLKAKERPPHEQSILQQNSAYLNNHNHSSYSSSSGNNQHPEEFSLVVSTELTTSTVIRPNQVLDLHARYGPQEYKCCFGLLPSIPTLLKMIRPQK